MPLALGTDIVEIKRIESAVQKHGEAFLQRFLTPEELNNGRSRGAAFPAYCAGRWAAKEAVAKMLGTGLGAKCSFQDIIIRNNAAGAPEVILQGNAKLTAEQSGIGTILISISHEQHYCVATVIGSE
jgi:holo-[acyl-carrier protein] synthase